MEALIQFEMKTSALFVLIFFAIMLHHSSITIETLSNGLLKLATLMSFDHIHLLTQLFSGT